MFFRYHVCFSSLLSRGVELSAWSYVLDGSTLFITGNDEINTYVNDIISENKVTDVVLEDGISGTSMKAFHNCNFLKSIKLPNSLTKIGSYSIVGSSITSLHIPINVSQISDGALTCNPFLKNITIDEENDHFVVRDNIAVYCNTMEVLLVCSANYSKSDFYVPEGVVLIGVSAFSFCFKIEKIHFSSTVREVGLKCFAYCASLKEIDLKNVAYIGKRCFYQCSNITTITIPKTVYKVDEASFFSLPSLREVIFEEGSCLRSIESCQFENSIHLKHIVLPGSITSIGPSSFKNCVSLETINIPDNVTTIYSLAFIRCSNLREVNISKNSKLKVIDSLSFGLTRISNIYLPDSLVDIRVLAFQNTSLESIDLPCSIRIINIGVFSSCNKLKSIVLKNVSCICSDAFSKCVSLEKVDIFIPENGTVIEDHAFVGSTGIKRISFTYLNSTGNLSVNFFAAFYGCKEIETITISDHRDFSIIDDVVYNSNKTNLLYYPPGRKKASYRVLESCNISEKAFSESKYLKAVCIKQDLSIGNGAFSFMNALESLRYCGSRLVHNSLFNNTKELLDIQVTKDYKGETFGLRQITKVVDKCSLEICEAQSSTEMSTETIIIIVSSLVTIIIFVVIVFLLFYKCNRDRRIGDMLLLKTVDNFTQIE